MQTFGVGINPLGTSARVALVVPPLCCCCLAPPDAEVAIDILDKSQSPFAPPAGRFVLPVCSACLRRAKAHSVQAVLAAVFWAILAAAVFLAAANGVIHPAYLILAFALLLSTRKVFFLVARQPASFTIEPDAGVNTWRYSFRNKSYQEAFASANPLLS